MSNPFEVLGLQPWADADEIRRAYRSLVKRCHPDIIQDPEEKQAAQERMVQLNLAYEEALRLARPRRVAAAPRENLSGSEAVRQARRMLERDNPACALRLLLRTEERDAVWYGVQGMALMAMEQYESAHQSFREAIRLEPEDYELRRRALDAVLAQRRSKSLKGMVHKAFRRLRKK